MKKELMSFILKLVEMTYKLCSKLRCAFCCCNSKCSVDQSITVENRCPNDKVASLTKLDDYRKFKA